MKKISHLFYVLILVFVTSLCFFIYQTDSEKKVYKSDLIELSNIKYGLFNVDEWKFIISGILVKKINEFELNSNNKKQLKSKISSFLQKEINNLEKRFYEQNYSSISGYFKNGVASFTGTFDKIKKDIPIFSKQIISYVETPKNKNSLKHYLIQQLDIYTKNTFSKIDYSKLNLILKKYNFRNRRDTSLFLNKKVENLEFNSNFQKKLLIFTTLVLIFSLFYFKENIDNFNFLILFTICFLFLILGLTLPMIEIDARISEFKMSLLSENVVFTDQVLYFKSKSILEVIQIMIFKGQFDLILVGFLIFIFSVVFPMSKLISSVLFISHKKLKYNKLINFLVFKTGKWSMADVMVVAIFMTYLGFSGVLSEQLSNVENLSEKIEMLTTNQSNLQIGFITFTSFTILSLFIANKLKHLKVYKIKFREYIKP